MRRRTTVISVSLTAVLYPPRPISAQGLQQHLLFEGGLRRHNLPFALRCLVNMMQMYARGGLYSVRGIGGTVVLNRRIRCYIFGGCPAQHALLPVVPTTDTHLTLHLLPRKKKKTDLILLFDWPLIYHSSSKPPVSRRYIHLNLKALRRGAACLLWGMVWALLTVGVEKCTHPIINVQGCACKCRAVLVEGRG